MIWKISNHKNNTNMDQIFSLRIKIRKNKENHIFEKNLNPDFLKFDWSGCFYYFHINFIIWKELLNNFLTRVEFKLSPICSQRNLK